jgi:XTP/dITP diphosphohydrolase
VTQFGTGGRTTGPAGGRPGERLLDLVDVMDRLRSPGGCPWDARQTHASLVEYLIEEAYEAVEAIELGDDPGLREELGDLLLQVVFHARIASERSERDGGWDIDAVADGIITKLVSRHPHVFEASASSAAAGGQPVTAEQVEADWHARKAREKGRESVTDGIPGALPSLVHAGKVLNRSLGLADRLPELGQSATAAQAMRHVEDEAAFGDLMLALVAQARARGYDAESAVRGAARRRIDAIRAAEGLA